MAQIAKGGHEGKTEERISDPACGSGRMFLAAAALHGKGPHFFGTDIDDMCCRMAAANMILHNLLADISCGNELTMRFSHVYIIRRVPYLDFPTLRILKYANNEAEQPKAEDPANNEAVLPEPKSKQEKYVQGNLF
ncbi:N-6 DNA Methylase [Chitinophaga eiseniae]|uniref:N-6 DNA Methylase n=1 Tax=Chitinophaga eiseniae TaxID=634771 RepID=A0A1T4SYZ6_9BACT|nr:N-6 DNA Methylase [Chitinophaga eiseniae]